MFYAPLIYSLHIREGILKKQEILSKKCASACLGRQALEGLAPMALFAMKVKTEATRGARRWSLDKKEMRKRLFRPDKRWRVWPPWRFLP